MTDARLNILKANYISSANTNGTIIAPGLVNIRNVSITTVDGSAAMTLPSTCVGNVIIYTGPHTDTFTLTMPSASALMAVVATRGGPIRVGDSFKTSIVNNSGMRGNVLTNAGVTIYPPEFTEAGYFYQNCVIGLTHIFTNVTSPAVTIVGTDRAFDVGMPSE